MTASYWILVALYALHVACAIVWFGGGLTGVLLVGPALQKTSEGARAEFSRQFGLIAHKIYAPASTLTILLGVLLAFVGGRVSSLEGLLSAYGITAAVALALACFVWYWGAFVIGASMARMQTAPPEARAQLLARALRNVALEQFGFVAVFVCMVLMRFGL